MCSAAPGGKVPTRVAVPATKTAPYQTGATRWDTNYYVCSSTDARIRFAKGFSLVAGRRPLLHLPRWSAVQRLSPAISLLGTTRPGGLDSHMVVDRRTQARVVRNHRLYSTSETRASQQLAQSAHRYGEARRE